MKVKKKCIINTQGDSFNTSIFLNIGKNSFNFSLSRIISSLEQKMFWFSFFFLI